jgi:hypothetical protein
MLRSQVITGLQAIRHKLDKEMESTDLEVLSDYYDEVLGEAIRAVLLNEQNDPYAKF